MAKDRPDANLVSGSGKRHASVSAPLRAKIVKLAQLIDHLRQVVFRDVAHFGNLGFGHKPVLMRGTIHQQTHRNISPFGNAHDRLPNFKMRPYCMSGKKAV
jgi:hypothetical protein